MQKRPGAFRRRGVSLLLLNGDGAVLGQLLLHILGHGDGQDAILKLGADVLRLHRIAHIEAAAARAGVALLTDVLALLIRLVLVRPLTA